MIQAIQIGPHQLVPLELLQVEIALRKEESLASLLAIASRGHAQIFRIFGECQGICVTQIYTVEKQRYLFVWIVAGRRILQHLNDLWDMLEQVAVSQECTQVVARPTERLAMIYQERLGFKLQDDQVFKEVNYGRRKHQDN